MIGMFAHLQEQRQIDRACAAQSPDLLPDSAKQPAKKSAKQHRADIDRRYFG